MSGPGSPGGARFPKSLRLRRRREFLRVQGRGRRIVAEPLLALWLPSSGGPTRLGLTVSTRVGNAVMRNRIRRRLRELFRRQQASIPAGLELVLIARRGAAEADWATLERAFARVLQRLPGKPA